jgi:hypothetical protein
MMPSQYAPDQPSDIAQSVSAVDEIAVDLDHRDVQQSLDAIGLGDGALVQITHGEDDVWIPLDDFFYVARGVLAEPPSESDDVEILLGDVPLLQFCRSDVPAHHHIRGQHVHQVGPHGAGTEDGLDGIRDLDLPAGVVGDDDGLQSRWFGSGGLWHRLRRATGQQG